MSLAYLFLPCLSAYLVVDSAVVSALLAIAKLQLPINMVLCVPLTENLPDGKATKPGDIITSMSGKTVEVDNTDAEGEPSAHTLLKPGFCGGSPWVRSSARTALMLSSLQAGSSLLTRCTTRLRSTSLRSVSTSRH